MIDQQQMAFAVKAADTVKAAGKSVKQTIERKRVSLGLALAFAAVYLFWGSTYLAIRVAIETLPPFLMAAMRFTLAGAALYGWAWVRGAPHPTSVHWRTAAVTGGLMLLGGNGIVVWAEQTVPSGQAAVLVSTVPLWVVVIGSVAARRRPTPPVLAGLTLGLVGLVFLIGPENLAGGDDASAIGLLALLFAAFSWALGTHYSRNAPQPASQTMSTGLNMIAGGLLLTLFSGLMGEFAAMDLYAVSLKSWLALGYLVVFGSLVGYSCYMWLVKATTPAKASSNFYVNPVVAVFLGWLLVGETVTATMLTATAIIVVAVALIVSQRGRRTRHPQRSDDHSAAAVAPPPC